MMRLKKDLEVFFSDYLLRENLQDKKLLLMVSGGIDSRVMLEVAASVVFQKKLAVFHLNHQLRPEANENEKFVKNICEYKKIRFYSEVLKTKPKKNKEEAWRKERQKKAIQYAKKFGAEKVLTAHHATDLVETMIFRLVKGAGPEGLSPFDISTKPFWNIPKFDIEQYARTHQLEWREDYTNENPEYERNLIRKQVIPELRKITPNLEKVLVQESIIFGETSNFLSEEVQKIESQKVLTLSSQESKIRLIDFQNFAPALQRAFLRKFVKKTPSFSEVEDGLKWLGHKPKGGSEKEIGGTKFKIEKNRLIIKN